MELEKINQQYEEIKASLELFLSRQLEIRERLSKIETKQDETMKLLTKMCND